MNKSATTLAILLSVALATTSTVTVAKPTTVTIDDTSRFLPAEAISSAATGAAMSSTWQKVRDPKSPSGWRLETTIKTKAPDLILPLDVKGPHAIHIGVYMPDTLTNRVLAVFSRLPEGHKRPQQVYWFSRKWKG